MILDSFFSLFDNLGLIAMIIFAIGLIFCVIEIFTPGFGVFGISGIIMVIGGIVFRFFLDKNLEHLIIMVMFVVSAVILAVVMMFNSAKHGLLGRSPLIEKKTAISRNYSADNKEYLKMLGKIAFASTKFSPAGKFVYMDNTYEAMSYGEYIEKGTKVQIVEVSGNTIYIKRVL